MELVSQQGMEGTVGKLSRLLPRIAFHVRGAYKRECASEAERTEELMRRREANAPPAQKVVEAFAKDAMESTTEHLPSRGHETRHALKDILLAIDEDIAAGRVMPYDKFVLYWRRFMAAARIFCRLRARARLRKWPHLYVALLDEHAEYYRERVQRVGVGGYEAEQKAAQRAAKRAYHMAAQPAHEDGQGNMVGGGRALVYQRVPFVCFPQ